MVACCQPSPPGDRALEGQCTGGGRAWRRPGERGTGRSVVCAPESQHGRRWKEKMRTQLEDEGPLDDIGIGFLVR